MFLFETYLSYFLINILEMCSNMFLIDPCEGKEENMAKFIKSKFKVLWGTIFAFLYGFIPNNVIAQEDSDSGEEAEQDSTNLDTGAIAAAVAASCFTRS